MLAIIRRIIKQMINDKRSLAMILLAPILIMSFMFIVLGESNYVPKVSLVDVPPAISQHLTDVEIVELSKDLDVALKDGDIDAIITYHDEITIRMLEPNSQVTTTITRALQDAQSKTHQQQSSLNLEFIYGNQHRSTFDSMVHVLLGIYSFFLVFLISGIAFVREQTLGTMERFMLTPISRFKVVAGFILGYGVFAVLQSILLIVFVVFVLNVTILGSWIGIIITMTLLSLVAIAVGALISGLAKNEFQVIQFIPLILTPQVFFSGLIPIKTLPYGLDVIAKFMPLQYAVSALNMLMNQGASFIQILPELAMLVLFLTVLFFFNTLALKKYRSI